MIPLSMLSADRPDCQCGHVSPPFCPRHGTAPRPLHVALRAVAERRGLGMAEAVRLVTPSNIVTFNPKGE